VSIQQIKHQKQAIIRQYATPDNLNGLTQFLTTLIPLGLLWGLVVISADISYWLVAALCLLMSLFTLRVLVLMHECGHGSLFRTPVLNKVFGFIFGVVAGMPQYVWSQHHDFHHANNGNWEKYRGPLTTPSIDEYAALTPWRQRMYRYTRGIALAPLGGFVYLIFNPRFNWLKGTFALLLYMAKEKLARPQESLRSHALRFQTAYWKSSKEYWHMFWNNLVLLTVWLAMCWLVGPGLFFIVYLVSVSLAGGAGIALFTVQHNFENAYATDTNRWDYDTGAIDGTSFLILPAWLNWFTANIAYHHVHHLSAKIPNYRLVECHTEYAHLFTSVTRVKLSRIPAALKCLLWDARAQQIVCIAKYTKAARTDGR
jgi:omega-6 fatty acid desaturase (delta-12 desaturase)